MVKDLTKGNPLKLILIFAAPTLLGDLFQQFYGMVDTIIVGQFISTNALAAVGITGSMMFLLFGFTMGFTTGFNIITAQRFGAGDKDGVRQVVAHSIWLSVGLTVVMTAVGLLTIEPMLAAMSTPPELMEDALAYITVIYWGVGGSVFYNLAAGTMRALGDSRSPLYFLIFSSALNIGLDLLFVLVFHWGVAGTAIATIIAQALSFLLSLWYMGRKYPMLHFKRQDFQLDFRLIGQLLKLGVSIGLQSSVTALGVMILQGAVNKLGSDVVAAYTAASRVEGILQTPLMTLGVAMATYTAQNLGAKRLDRIQEGVRKCMAVALGICGVCMAAMFFLGRQITQFFIEASETEVVSIAVQYIWVVAPFFLVLTLLFVYRNAVQGMGDSMTPMVSGIIELVCRVIVAAFFSAPFGFWAICWSEPFAWVLCTIPVIAVYYWRVHRLRRSLG